MVKDFFINLKLCHFKEEADSWKTLASVNSDISCKPMFQD